MTNQKVSNEQIDQKLNLVLEHLKFHEKRFDNIDREFEKIDNRFEKVDKQFDKIRTDMDARFNAVDTQFKKVDDQFKEVRTDIAKLKKVRLTWNSGILAGVTVMSSILVILLMRILSFIGIRVVDLASYFV